MTKNLVRREEREQRERSVKAREESRYEKGRGIEGGSNRYEGEGNGFTRVAEEKNSGEGVGGRYVQEEYVLKEVVQIAECNQPRLALRFMIIRVPVTIHGKPVQRKLP